MNSVAVGLCATCRHTHQVTSDRGVTYWRCRLAEVDPAFPKYPALPVLRCRGYQASGPDSSPPGG